MTGSARIGGSLVAARLSLRGLRADPAASARRGSVAFAPLAVALFAAATNAAEAQIAQAEDQGNVRCYGVAKAGENDCANAVGTHSCAGQSGVSYSGAEWKALDDVEACVKEGGQLRPFVGANSKRLRDEGSSSENP